MWPERQAQQDGVKSKVRLKTSAARAGCLPRLPTTPPGLPTECVRSQMVAQQHQFLPGISTLRLLARFTSDRHTEI